jgi:hypothetical protein
VWDRPVALQARIGWRFVPLESGLQATVIGQK